MLDQICGSLAQIKADSLVVLVGTGLLLQINVATETLSLLSSRLNQSICLYTDLKIKNQERFQLLGFVSEHNREMFHIISKVPNLSDRLALELSTDSGASLIHRYIMDSKAINIPKLTGLGPKTFTKLISHISDDKRFLQLCALATRGDSELTTVSYDAILALEALGFERSHSLRVLTALISESPQDTLEDLISKAAKRLMVNS